MKKTLIILPAYNVEKEIYNLLSNMQNYIDNVIIVDDGSTDNTFQIIDSLNYNVIRQEKNAGVLFSNLTTPLFKGVFLFF